MVKGRGGALLREKVSTLRPHWSGASLPFLPQHVHAWNCCLHAYCVARRRIAVADPPVCKGKEENVIDCFSHLGSLPVAPTHRWWSWRRRSLCASWTSPSWWTAWAAARVRAPACMEQVTCGTSTAHAGAVMHALWHHKRTHGLSGGITLAGNACHIYTSSHCACARCFTEDVLADAAPHALLALAACRAHQSQGLACLCCADAMPVEIVQFCWQYNMQRLQNLPELAGNKARDPRLTHALLYKCRHAATGSIKTVGWTWGCARPSCKPCT